jgi:hypothetical protein
VALLAPTSNKFNAYELLWSKEEVLEKLDRKMTEAYHAVSNLARTRNIYMRDAALYDCNFTRCRSLQTSWLGIIDPVINKKLRSSLLRRFLFLFNDL